MCYGWAASVHGLLFLPASMDLMPWCGCILQGDRYGQNAPFKCRQPLPGTPDGKPGRLFDGLRCAMAWWPPFGDIDGEISTV